MASTYSPNLALELIANGEQAGTWGNTTNTNLGTLIEEAISGYTTQAMSDAGDTTISIPNGASGTARNMYLRLTGTLTAARNLIVPSNKKLYFIHNNTTGGFAVTVKVSGQTGVSVPNGAKMVLVSNGTDIVEAVTHFNTFTCASINATPIGATTASTGAFTTLSASSTVSGTGFTNYFASPPAIGGTAANTVTATRVIVNGSTIPANGIYLPATNELGVATNTTNRLTVKTGLVMAGATGGTAGDMGAGTINATGVYINGVAVGTGSGSVSSVNVSGGTTGLSFSGGPVTTSGTITMAGTLGVANGGTGNTAAPANNQLLVGNGTGYTLRTLTAGSGISVTTGTGTITVAATGGSGTVTNVTANSPLSVVNGTTTPDITLGTVPVSKGGTGTITAPTSGQLLIGTSTGGYQVANLTAGSNITISNSSGGITINASGSTGVSSISFGSTGLTPSTATTGAVSVAGTLGAGFGGTGQNTYTTGDILYASNSNTLSKLIGVATGNALISGGVATAPSWGKIGLTTHVSGTLAVANGGTGVTSSTGSGSNVLSTSPALVTPDLGTPSAGNLGSCTVDGTNAVGFKNIPQTTSTTLAATSVGKHHYVSAGVTINTGVFSAGDAFMIVNSGTSNITITQGASVTLRLAGTATTGSRTLAQKGVASVLCVAAGDFIVSGAGVT